MKIIRNFQFGGALLRFAEKSSYKKSFTKKKKNIFGQNKINNVEFFNLTYPHWFWLKNVTTDQ